MLYAYNTKTGEYAMSIPFETEICEGRTDIEPPKVIEGEEITAFNTTTQKWEIYKDYRFTHKMLSPSGEVLNIEDFGDIPEENELITNEQANEILEKQAVKKRYMSKQDFYEYVVKANGISYSQLVEFISTNSDIQAAWELCNFIYRGNQVLNDNFKTFLPKLTDEELDEIFKQYGKLDEN